ncbi:MAG: hypothetical protein AAGC70_19840 [Pseudomonadota bacterium]
MITKAIFLMFGFVVGMMAGVTAVYKLHPTMTIKSRCSYNLTEAQTMIKNGNYVDEHRMKFRGAFDFVGVAVLPVRDAIFDTSCHDGKFDVALALFYLRNNGAMSLADFKKLRSYAKKNNHTELVKLISSATNSNQERRK